MLDVLRHFNLSIADAADLMKIHPKTLQKWRYKGYGPKWLKIGKECRYSEREIVNWLGQYNEWLRKAE